MRCSIKTGGLRNFVRFTRKHSARASFLNKAAGWGLQLYLKMRLRHMCFPVIFAKFLRILFFRNTSGWLLLALKDYLPREDKTCALMSKSKIDQTDFTGCMPLLLYRLMEEISLNTETPSTNIFSSYEIAKKTIMI